MFKKICLIILLTILGFSFYKNRDVFRVETIEISNATEYDLNEDNLKLESYYQKQFSEYKKELNYLQNIFMWDLPLKKITELSSKPNWVDDVRVIRHWPNKLELKIKTKILGCLLVNGNGKIIPVAKDGTLLPQITMQEAPSLPFLRGLELNKNMELRKKAVDFISQLSDEGMFSKHQVVEIFYKETEGFIATLDWKGLLVKLGYNPNSVTISRLKQVLEYIKNKNISGKIVDANFSKRVLVKLQN